MAAFLKRAMLSHLNRVDYLIEYMSQSDNAEDRRVAGDLIDEKNLTLAYIQDLG